MVITSFPLTTGRGLASTRPLAKGEVFLQVPVQALLTTHSAMTSDIAPILSPLFLSTLITSTDVLCLHLLRELRRGTSSAYYHYMQSLPSSYETFLYYSDKDILAIQPAVRRSDVRTAVRSTLTTYRRLHRYVFSRYRYLFFPFTSNCHRPFNAEWHTQTDASTTTPSSTLSTNTTGALGPTGVERLGPHLRCSQLIEEELQAVRWCLSTISTRSCYWPVPYRNNDTTDTSCLVPFGDMANFAMPPPEAPPPRAGQTMTGDTQGGDGDDMRTGRCDRRGVVCTGYDAVNKAYMFVAERDYNIPGEEVSICYCRKGDWDLIKVYGFAIPDNRYTAIKIVPDLAPLISDGVPDAPIGKTSPDTISSCEHIAQYGLTSSWYFERGEGAEAYPSHNMLTALRLHYGATENKSKQHIERVVCGESLASLNMHAKELSVWEACLRACEFVKTKYETSLDHDQGRLVPSRPGLVSDAISGLNGGEDFPSQNPVTASRLCPIQMSLLIQNINEKRLIADIAVNCHKQIACITRATMTS
eukprot:GHVS01064429.1.p1 GENE.GHVS01064429.1~~GHVS01064429.1.p1  ORF type:complete len:559 (-),score=50.95 GHVS01064429.1:300-1889(-)